MKNLTFLFLFLTTSIISGCAQNNFAIETQIMAKNNGFEKKQIITPYFTHIIYEKTTKQKPQENKNIIRIYIEGDGRAYLSRTMVSNDPTPKNPTALQLATLDNFENVIYLARPCQQEARKIDPKCNNRKWWTTSRFSNEVMLSFNEVLNKLKQNKEQKFEIIAFSGGAAVAIYLASNRNDIIKITTIAGNINVSGINAHHKVTPLKNAYEPFYDANKIKHIPQTHFAGGKDKIIPPKFALEFAKKQNSKKVKVIIAPNNTHNKGWQKTWQSYLQQQL